MNAQTTLSDLTALVHFIHAFMHFTHAYFTSCFHGFMNADEAKAALVDMQEGTYLLRFSGQPSKFPAKRR